MILYTLIIREPPSLMWNGYWVKPGWTISITTLEIEKIAFVPWMSISVKFKPKFWVKLEELKINKID